MKVADVMSKRVVKVTGITMLPEVAQKMADENIGVVPVEEGQRLVGIVTDRDIALRAVAKRSIDVPVKDVMTPNPVKVPSSTTIEEAIRTMLQHHVRRLLVTENDKLVGVVSLEDLLEGGEEAELMKALKQLHKETRHS